MRAAEFAHAEVWEFGNQVDCKENCSTSKIWQTNHFPSLQTIQPSLLPSNSVRKEWYISAHILQIHLSIRSYQENSGTGVKIWSMITLAADSMDLLELYLEHWTSYKSTNIARWAHSWAGGTRRTVTTSTKHPLSNQFQGQIMKFYPPFFTPKQGQNGTLKHPYF